MSALPTLPTLPPPAQVQSAKCEVRSFTTSIYQDFTEIEKLIAAAARSLCTDDMMDALTSAAGKLLTLREIVCSKAEGGKQRADASYRATVFDRRTNEETTVLVTAEDMHEAERRALAKANLNLRGDPRQLTVRHLHELCAACGQTKEGGWSQS